MVTSTLTATVLNYDRARGYGFAQPSDNTADLFLHRSNLQPDRRYLNPGDVISCDIGERNGRKVAIHIKFLFNESEAEAQS
jgi:cold shock CspA family protein